MTNPLKPLGQEVYGQARLGDGQSVQIYPRSSALSVSYAITPSKYGAALSVSYTLQRGWAAPLAIYYTTSANAGYSIQLDSSIIAPDTVIYQPRAVAGRTLLGGQLLQGYDSMVWNYSVLQWSEFQKIISYYDPLNPVVTIGFLDPSGGWSQQQAVMHPPQYGTMSTFLISDIQLSFTRLFLFNNPSYGVIILATLTDTGVYINGQGWVGWQGGSVSYDPVNSQSYAPGIISGIVTANAPTSSTSALTNVSASTSSTTILATNGIRKAAYIYNDSASAMYLAYAATASTSSFTVKIQAGNFFEMPTGPIYTGALSAVWDTAVGSARATELV